MAVLPDSMDRLNADDAQSSLSLIERYINYMRERIEFSFANMTKSVAAAGMLTNVEALLLLNAHAHSISALESRIAELSGALDSNETDIGAVQTVVAGMAAEIEELQTESSAMELRTSSLETKMQTAESNIQSIVSAIDGLNTRLTALENQ